MWSLNASCQCNGLLLCCPCEQFWKSIEECVLPFSLRHLGFVFSSNFGSKATKTFGKSSEKIVSICHVVVHELILV